MPICSGAEVSSIKQKVVPDICQLKNSRHFLMHWISAKLPDNFQIREHSWPCWFHINNNNNDMKIMKIILLLLSSIS
jgi:hypothetical protein